MDQSISYPARVSEADWPSLKDAKVKEVYFVYMTEGSTIVNSDVRVVTHDNRVGVFTTVPKKEIMPAHFNQAMLLPVFAHRWGVGSARHFIYDQGKAIAAGYWMQEFQSKDNDLKDLLMHEGKARYLDVANFKSVTKWQGIKGLEPYENVHIEALEVHDPRRAQLLFDAAVDVKKMLDRGFAHNIAPRENGSTGINGNTNTGLIAERAYELAVQKSNDGFGKAMTRSLNLNRAEDFEEAMYWASTPDYRRKIAAHGLMVGSPLSSRFKGPNLATVRKLAQTDIGKWKEGVYRPLPPGKAVVYDPH